MLRIYPRGANGIWRIRSYCLSAENNFLIHINKVQSLLLPHAVPCLSVLDVFPRARIIYIGIGAEQYV